MEKRSLVTIADHSREKIEYLIQMAQEFEKHPNRRLLEGRIVATLFFEPSTRTRLSFETAANRLGARVIGFADPKVTSGTKGETLKDTIMMVSNYADIIVMRHYLEGAARYASEIAPVPIVNAGDGANQHPSQTMLDLYSIYKTQGRLDDLDIFLVGDLKYGRTVHSMLNAMYHFHPTFHFIAPEELAMPRSWNQVCGTHRFQCRRYLWSRHPVYDSCATRTLHRPHGIRTREGPLSAETRHALEGTSEHEDSASPASCQRDRIQHRRESARLLFRAGSQRPLCPSSPSLRRAGHNPG